jgi:hypothetical protein
MRRWLTRALWFVATIASLILATGAEVKWGGK